MTDQLQLLAQLSRVRKLLNSPTSMKADSFAAAKIVATNIADRCYFNSGWHAAGADKQLSGAAATAQLQQELQPLLDLLEAKAKPKRGKGRPSVDAIDPEYLQVVAWMALIGEEYKREIVKRAIKAGILKDKEKIQNGVRKTTTLDAHVKKATREFEKLAKRPKSPKRRTNNVLIFRPKKKPRRKIDKT